MPSSPISETAKHLHKKKSTRIQKVLSEGTQLFLVDWGIERPNTALIGPSSGRQRNAIEMAFRWQADDGPTLYAGFVALRFFQGIRISIAKNTLYFCDFSGGPNPLSPPLDPPMLKLAKDSSTML